jgi:hypothetical protein
MPSSKSFTTRLLVVPIRLMSVRASGQCSIALPVTASAASLLKALIVSPVISQCSSLVTISLKSIGVALIPATAPDFFTEDTPTAVLVRPSLGCHRSVRDNVAGRQAESRPGS